MRKPSRQAQELAGSFRRSLLSDRIGCNKRHPLGVAFLPAAAFIIIDATADHMRAQIVALYCS